MDHDAFEALAGKKPAITSVDIVLDDAWADEISTVRARLAKAQQRLRAGISDADLDVAECEEQLAKLVEQQAGKVVTFKFRTMDRPEGEALVRAHPARAEHRKEHGRGILYNPESYPKALVAASLTDPPLSVEQVDELFDRWGQPELQALVQAANQAQTVRRTVDLGEA